MKRICVDVRVTEALELTIGDERVRITVEDKSGRLARLRVEAPPNVTVTPPRKK